MFETANSAASIGRFSSFPRVFPMPGPGMVDEDPSHRLGRDPKKIGRGSASDLSLVDKPEVDLIYQGGRLECMAGPFSTQVARSLAMELRVDHRHLGLQCVGLADTPLLKPKSYFRRPVDRLSAIRSGSRRFQELVLKVRPIISSITINCSK